MHRCGLLHRDLKPANILIGNEFDVSLIDFGVSRIQDDKRPMTMNVGTTGKYMPNNHDYFSIFNTILSIISLDCS